MSISTATLRAARTSTGTSHASLKKPTPNFLRFIFQPEPAAINCCTQNTTRDYLDNPAHPYHIKINRRIAAFDATKLHSSVVAHIDVAKKSVVRSWVTRRVRVALKAELEKRGYSIDGKVLEIKKESRDGTGIKTPTSPLKGALKIYMATDNRKQVVTATGEEVRQNVSAIVGEVVRRQSRGTQGHRNIWEDRRKVKSRGRQR